jgi:glyoxylase-like metal-dependent hydrolase (beta-lactamase superfamily II)
MHVGGYDIEIIVQGYPGKAVCHGGLGWSTLALLRGQGRVVVVDTGPFGYRPLILERLGNRGLKPAAVTDLLLTHCHHDHSVNWVMFKDARIVIGDDEMAWALKLPWGSNSVPEFYVAELQKWPTMRRVKDGEEVWPGLTAYLAPGHTPGCLFYVLEGAEHDLIFTGDAAKNRAELVSRDTDMSYDKTISAASIDRIWSHWRKKPGTIVIPGHDTPMVLRDGKPAYIGKLEASIKSWTGDDMETTTVFELTA